MLRAWCVTNVTNSNPPRPRFSASRNGTHARRGRCVARYGKRPRRLNRLRLRGPGLRFRPSVAVGAWPYQPRRVEWLARTTEISTWPFWPRLSQTRRRFRSMMRVLLCNPANGFSDNSTSRPQAHSTFTRSYRPMCSSRHSNSARIGSYGVAYQWRRWFSSAISARHEYAPASLPSSSNCLVAMSTATSYSPGTW
jgi:hypothetical protein